MKTLQQLYDKYGKIIEEAAFKYDLDPCVLAGLTWQESRGNSGAVSSCGALGLTQVLPSTAEDREYDLSTPRGQINAGADYLRWLLDNFAEGNIENALGGYNAGPARIKDEKWRRIKESAHYVPAVLAYAEEYRKLLPPIVAEVEVKKKDESDDIS
jgi:soluble lytic murein transglycosylase-like protein